MRIDWMWGWGGLGGVGLLGLVLFLVFWGLVIAALVLLIRRLVRSDERNRYDGPPPWERHVTPPGAMPGSASPAVAPAPGIEVGPGLLGMVQPLAGQPSIGGPATASTALETLRQRYARGEIDEAEFERRRAFLDDVRGGGVGGCGGGADGAGGGPAGSTAR